MPIKKSSWVALRVLPSSHTNPIFVLVGGKPVRASRKSAEWCLKAVDQCWAQKEKAIRPAEREEAKKAYEVARQAYRKILSEAVSDCLKARRRHARAIDDGRALRLHDLLALSQGNRNN